MGSLSSATGMDGNCKKNSFCSVAICFAVQYVCDCVISAIAFVSFFVAVRHFSFAVLAVRNVLLQF